MKRISDEEGAFTFDVPAETTRLRVVVSAPGRTLQIFDVPVTRAPLLLEVAPAGGTLDLSWPKGKSPRVTHAGIPLALPDLIAWSQRHGALWSDRSLRVPNLAPGSYRLCVMTGPEDALKSSCREGFIAPGSTLTLAITP